MATSADFQETVSIFFPEEVLYAEVSVFGREKEKKRETTDTARVLKGLLYPCSSCSHCWWSRKKTRRSHGKSGGRKREKKLSRDSRRIPLFNHGINKRCWRLSYKNRDKTRNCGRNTKLMGISPDVTLSQSASVVFISRLHSSPCFQVTICCSSSGSSSGQFIPFQSWMKVIHTLFMFTKYCFSKSSIRHVCHDSRSKSVVITLNAVISSGMFMRCSFSDINIAHKESSITVSGKVHRSSGACDNL